MGKVTEVLRDCARPQSQSPPVAIYLLLTDGSAARKAQNLSLVKRVVAIADKKGCTPGQLALAWVQARRAWTGRSTLDGRHMV